MNPQPWEKIPRDSKYLAHVRNLPCCKCPHDPTGYVPPGMNPHHTEHGGVGIVGSDYSALPLCLPDHRDLHQKYSKRGYWTEEELEALISETLAGYPGTINNDGLIWLGNKYPNILETLGLTCE